VAEEEDLRERLVVQEKELLVKRAFSSGKKISDLRRGKENSVARP
jgi:hypothetical protein